MGETLEEGYREPRKTETEKDRLEESDTETDLESSSVTLLIIKAN